MVTPAVRKNVASHMIDNHRLSERRACQLSGVSRTAFRYQPVVRQDQELRHRLLDLAAKHNGLGYPMLHGMLKSESLVVNRKRTYRLYSEEGLQLRHRRKKKLKRPPMPLVVPLGIVPKVVIRRARFSIHILPREPQRVLGLCQRSRLHLTIGCRTGLPHRLARRIGHHLGCTQVVGVHKH